MSGQLVGEVLAASQELRAYGLRERGFHALVAIAEKCSAETRQGSVRWDHIRAGLYGASLSTAKRAVADLKAAGLILVVRRGFDNQNGRAAAPIYEIADWITQVTQSVKGRTDHSGDPIGTDRTDQLDDPIAGGRTGQIDDRTGQIDDRTGHPDDLLDGSIDGSTGGGRPRCAKHAAHLDPPSCPGCREARYAAEAAKQAALDAEQADRKRAGAQRRAALDAAIACTSCNGTGRDLETDIPCYHEGVA